jgi:hypothetical protein
MNSDRELMQMALDALKKVNDTGFDTCRYKQFDKEVKALRDRLAQPEPEPAAQCSYPKCQATNGCIGACSTKPVAWWDGKENVVFAHDTIDTPNWTDYWTKPLYADPTPCKTCEALARTVMMDQTSHDTTSKSIETAVLAEREACAEICDGISDYYETRTDLNQTQKQVGQLAAEVCGVRIRERGEI